MNGVREKHRVGLTLLVFLFALYVLLMTRGFLGYQDEPARMAANIVHNGRLTMIEWPLQPGVHPEST